MYSCGHSWHRRASVQQPARTYQQQLCTDPGFSMDNLPKLMVNRDEWKEKVWEIRASSTPWYIYIYIYNEISRILFKLFIKLSVDKLYSWDGFVQQTQRSIYLSIGKIFCSDQNSWCFFKIWDIFSCSNPITCDVSLKF